MMKTWSILLCLVLQGAAFRAPAPIAPRARVDGGVVEGFYFDARASDAAIPYHALRGSLILEDRYAQRDLRRVDAVSLRRLELIELRK